MEFQDYVGLHKKFGVPNPDNNQITNAIYNPYNGSYKWKTYYHEEENKIIGTWFELTEDTFTVTQECSPYTLDVYRADSDCPVQEMLPKAIKYDYINANDFGLNGYIAHEGLVLDTNTGKGIKFKQAPFPITEEDTIKAVSILRKHITAFKKKARPIYRLLEGSLTDDQTNTNYAASWRNRRSDNMQSHELYEILRQRSPTPKTIKLLIENGNSAASWGSYVSATNFEAAIARVIQRRRKELQSFALLEANNEYESPTPSTTE